MYSQQTGPNALLRRLHLARRRPSPPTPFNAGVYRFSIKSWAMSSSQSCLVMPPCCGVDIEDLSIQQLQDHLQGRSFTSKELVQCYMKRIELVNPYVRAVIETNPDALQ